MQSTDTRWCTRCGIEIFVDFWVVDNQIYCCRDCAEGLPCDCGERLEQEDERRAQAGAPAFAGEAA